MGAIAAFKEKFYGLDRSTIDLKRRAIVQAWRDVSNDSLKNIWKNCGLIGKEPIASFRTRFMKEVKGVLPEEYENLIDFYEGWKNGAFDVQGATLGGGIALDTPEQITQAHLDGDSWTNYGFHRL